jgi:site-specific recombinase XerD
LARKPTSGRTTFQGQTIDCLRPFLDRRRSADGLELGTLTPGDVISFVVAWCPRLNGGVAELTVTALRSFLGFLHLDGVTERLLVSAVPKVSRRRLAGLPKGLEPDQVRRLLAACDPRTPIGCRDLAILTLLVRFGLRRGEVAGPKLDDIDWRAGTISVVGKGSTVERIPLPSDVGHPIANYLARARPADAQCRAVFVRHFMRVSVGSVSHDRSGRAGCVANYLRAAQIVRLTAGCGGGSGRARGGASPRRAVPSSTCGRGEEGSCLPARFRQDAAAGGDFTGKAAY